MRTQLEMERRRERIIDYYVNVANRAKLATFHHFKPEKLRRNYVYKVIKMYESRGSVKVKKDLKAGPKPKATTPENLRRLQELLKMDPSVTNAEAAQALGMAKTSVRNLRLKLMASLNSTSSDATAAVSKENGVQDGGDELEHEDHYFGDMASQDSPVAQDEDESPEDIKQVESVSEKPCPLPLSVSKMTKKRCLICLQSFQKESTTPALQENVTVIFVLRTILGLNSEDLVTIMELSKGNDPKDWTDFCVKCNDLVEKAVDIQVKIRQLEKEMTKCKEEIKQNIKNTSGVKFRRICNRRKLLVEKKVRDLIRKEKRTSTPVRPNPFDEGDKEAESRLKLIQVQTSEILVKTDHEEFESSEEVDTCQDIDFDCGDDTNDDMEPHIPEVLVSLETENMTTRKEVLPSSMPSQGDGDETPTITSNDNGDSIDVNPAPPPPTIGVCDVCGVEMRPLALPIHKLKEHGVVMEGYSVKKCSFEDCKYETLYDYHLKAHARRHELPRIHSCHFCGKVFKDSKGVQRHEEIHKNAETRPYQCEICGASFAVDAYLYLHTRLSHQGRHFPSTKRKRLK